MDIRRIKYLAPIALLVAVLTTSQILAEEEGETGLLEKTMNYLSVKGAMVSAEGGDPVAQSYIGYAYRKGVGGLPQDYQLALMWYHKAASQGNARAQNDLGHMYSKGLGVERDYKIAFTWFTKAAIQGYAWAQSALGYYYRFGFGVVEKDKNKAYRWYLRSAAQGNAIGQYNIGMHYYKGIVVEKDHKQALEWLYKAAEQKHNKATNNIIWILSTSKDSSVRDGKKAVKLIERFSTEKLTMASYYDTIAAAYAEIGDFDKAVTTQEKAILHLSGKKKKRHLGGFKKRLSMYQNKKPWRE